MSGVVTTSRPARARREVGDRALGDQAALGHHGRMRADLLDLVEEVRGEEDGRALRRQLPHQGADLAHALRVEAVRRLVQDEEPARLEQRRGEAEALLHAERVRLRLLARGGRQAHPVEGRLGAGPAGARVGGRVRGVVPQEVVAAGEEAVEGGALDERAHVREHRAGGARHGAAEDPCADRRSAR